VRNSCAALVIFIYRATAAKAINCRNVITPHFVALLFCNYKNQRRKYSARFIHAYQPVTFYHSKKILDSKAQLRYASRILFGNVRCRELQSLGDRKFGANENFEVFSVRC